MTSKNPYASDGQAHFAAALRRQARLLDGQGFGGQAGGEMGLHSFKNRALTTQKPLR